MRWVMLIVSIIFYTAGAFLFMATQFSLHEPMSFTPTAIRTEGRIRVIEPVRNPDENSRHPFLYYPWIEFTTHGGAGPLFNRRVDK